MKVVIEKNELVVRIPLQEPTPSASGKTLVIATTHGNVMAGVKYKGRDVKVGLTAYIPNK